MIFKNTESLWKSQFEKNEWLNKNKLKKRRNGPSYKIKNPH